MIETQVIEFSQAGRKDAESQTSDMWNRVKTRDNIAVVAALEFASSGARLLVVSGHIFWNHIYRDVKLVQIATLTEELEGIAERFAALPPRVNPNPNPDYPPPTYDPSEKGRDIPIVLCVDVNSPPGSAVHEYLSTGDLAPDHEDWQSYKYGRLTEKGMKHRLGFKSAASSFGEMKMTNFTPTFVAPIDYIFHTAKTLRVTSVLGDVDEGYLEKVVGFPNAHFPSE
jgi:CCR4-NOT transcription complex subunit 6